MTIVFNNMCAANGVENDMMAWLVSQDVLDEVTMACLSDDDAGIKDLVKAAKASGVKFATVGKEAAVKKLWLACRKAADAPSKASSSSTPLPAQDEPILKEHEVGIKAEWSRRHDFIIPHSCLLVPSLQGKIWRGLQQGGAMNRCLSQCWWRRCVR